MRNAIIRVVTLAVIVLAAVASLCGCQKFADERMTQEEFTALYNERGDAMLSDQVKALFPDAHFDIKVLDFQENYSDSAVVYNIKINQNVAIGDASKIDWEKVCAASRITSIQDFTEEADLIASFATDHRVVNVNPVYPPSEEVEQPELLFFVDDGGACYEVYPLAVHKYDGDKETTIWRSPTLNNTQASSSNKTTSTGTATTKKTCPSCHGTGHVKYYAGGAGSDYTYGTCTDCNGTGYVR